MLTKAEIRELSERYKLGFKKSLGQNFLIDKNTRDKLVGLLGLGRNDVIIEIGPGLGAITERLAESGGYVYAVEKDKRLCELAERLLSGFPNLEIVCGDFLKFDISRLLLKGIKVVGALPYCITTPIIERIIGYRNLIDSAFIAVQKEVARRLAAKAKDDDYGSLSIFVQFYSDVSVLMGMKRTVFFPEPKVDSAFVRLRMLSGPRVKVKDEEVFFKAVRAAFSQRRKTILCSLSHKNILSLGKDRIAALLESIGIDKKKRAEELTIEQFAAIADRVAQEK